VPRRHRAERAAAVAHVAQKRYGRGERTLGVMPLYHRMCIRSLLLAGVVGGAVICLPRFDVAGALYAIKRHGVTNLYLVLTHFHDIVHHAALAVISGIGGMLAGPLIGAVAGLAMITVLLSAFQSAFDCNAGHQIAAFVALIVAMSNVSFLSISAPFWALVAGSAVSVLNERVVRSPAVGSTAS